MFRPVILVDVPALKSVTICGRVARLSRLMILVNRRWSRTCMIYFLCQGYRKYDVLPDSPYSRHTREMVVRENPNFFAISEMICSNYRTEPITPCLKSLKS
ncbi:uncharacterized protein TNCV_4728041 [Trichonephila clavipes]|nr:uncharacterized protein TNCV_4728041 [Trichonephila clavipes]